MDRFSYSSLSAMRSAMARQTTTANNLANANTPGFRADMAAQQALWLDGPGVNGRAVAGEEVRSADMAEGAAAATGRPLDVALHKDALLGVQAADGEEAYTRRGDLQVSDSGLLTNGDGAPVLGESGPITIPPADKISIAEDGTVSIVPLGGDAAQPPVRVDRLKLVATAGSDVVKGVDGLFRVRGGGALPADPDGKVTVGSLEGSNVNTAQALVDMIDASRGWETQVRMLAEGKDIDVSGAALMKLDE